MHQITVPARAATPKAVIGHDRAESLAPVASYVLRALSHLEALSAKKLPAVGLIAIHEEQRNASYWTIQRAKAANRFDTPALVTSAEGLFNCIESFANNHIDAGELATYLLNNGAAAKEAASQFTKPWRISKGVAQ